MLPTKAEREGQLVSRQRERGCPNGKIQKWAFSGNSDFTEKEVDVVCSTEASGPSSTETDKDTT